MLFIVTVTVTYTLYIIPYNLHLTPYTLYYPLIISISGNVQTYYIIHTTYYQNTIPCVYIIHYTYIYTYIILTLNIHTILPIYLQITTSFL